MSKKIGRNSVFCVHCISTCMMFKVQSCSNFMGCWNSPCWYYLGIVLVMLYCLVLLSYLPRFIDLFLLVQRFDLMIMVCGEKWPVNCEKCDDKVLFECYQRRVDLSWHTQRIYLFLPSTNHPFYNANKIQSDERCLKMLELKSDFC